MQHWSRSFPTAPAQRNCPEPQWETEVVAFTSFSVGPLCLPRQLQDAQYDLV